MARVTRSRSCGPPGTADAAGSCSIRSSIAGSAMNPALITSAIPLTYSRAGKLVSVSRSASTPAGGWNAPTRLVPDDKSGVRQRLAGPAGQRLETLRVDQDDHCGPVADQRRELGRGDAAAYHDVVGPLTADRDPRRGHDPASCAAMSAAMSAGWRSSVPTVIVASRWYTGIRWSSRIFRVARGLPISSGLAWLSPTRLAAAAKPVSR